MELEVPGHALHLVAALEAEVVAAVVVLVGQDGDLGAGAVGVGAGRDEADAARLERGEPVDLDAVVEEACVVVDVAVGVPGSLNCCLSLWSDEKQLEVGSTSGLAVAAPVSGLM